MGFDYILYLLIFLLLPLFKGINSFLLEFEKEIYNENEYKEKDITKVVN